MATNFNTHPNFQGGIYPDQSGYAIPPGGLYDALDILLDQPGKLRKRGGTTATGTQTAKLVDILAFESGSTGINPQMIGLHGTGATGNSPGFSVIDTGTGGMTDIVVGGPPGTPGGPYTLGNLFMHLGFMCCPVQCPKDYSWNHLMVYGGYDGTSARTVYSPAVPQPAVTAGDPRITCVGTAFLTNVSKGEMIYTYDGGGHAYIGRITSIVSDTVITVEPEPTLSFVGTIGALFVYPSMLMQLYDNTHRYLGGATACSWQNRVVYANLSTDDSLGGSSTPTSYARRVQWTTTPDEHDVPYSDTAKLDGFTAAFRDAVFPNNFDQVAGSGPIKSIRSIGIGQLAVLGRNSIQRISGDLQTMDSTVVDATTFDVWPISPNIGSISDACCIETPHGLIFPSNLGVFFYDGSRLLPLMDQRVARTFRDLLRGGAVCHGASLIKNHYVLSVKAGSTVPTGYTASATFQFMLNLDDVGSPAWTRLSNLDLFAGSQDHTDDSIFWGLRWWDTSAAAPSHTNGHVIRLDSIFNPTSANKSDADGTAVTSTIKTRAYVEGDAEQLKRFTQAAYQYRLTGPGVVTVSVDGNLEPNEATWESVGTLPPNTALTITAATAASPIVCTTATHSYTTGDRVVIRDGLVMTGLNGSWFITVLSATTFSLNGSTGSGTYTASSATVSQPDTKTFPITNKMPRAFAIEHKIVQTVATDRFELYSIRNGWQNLRSGRVS